MARKNLDRSRGSKVAEKKRKKKKKSRISTITRSKDEREISLRTFRRSEGSPALADFGYPDTERTTREIDLPLRKRGRKSEGKAGRVALRYGDSRGEREWRLPEPARLDSPYDLFRGRR